MENTIKKAVLMLDDKYYHAYDQSMLDEAKKRASCFKNDGRKVSLRWEDMEAVNLLESNLMEVLNKIKILKAELKLQKNLMSDDNFTWGRCNPGTIRIVNNLELQIKQLEASI